MRRISKKRRKRLEEVYEWRANFRAEIGRCEWCRKRTPVIHEISRGPSRVSSLDKRYCLLGLCHPICHDAVGAWPRAKQLALLLIRRPADFDLDAFWTITARRYPDLEDVLAFVTELQENLP